MRHLPTSATDRCPHCGRAIASPAAHAPRYQAETFAALLQADPARAARLFVAMPPDARVRQARAHVAWCRSRGVATGIAAVLASWHATLAPLAGERPSLNPPAPLDPKGLSDLLSGAPTEAAALLRRMSPSERIAQGLSYAAWLASYGLALDLAVILEVWEAMLAAPGGKC